MNKMQAPSIHFDLTRPHVTALCGWFQVTSLQESLSGTSVSTAELKLLAFLSASDPLSSSPLSPFMDSETL